MKELINADQILSMPVENIGTQRCRSIAIQLQTSNGIVLFHSLCANEGVNFIELVQRETGSDWGGFEDEKWPVRNLRVDIDNSSLIETLIPVIGLILNDD